MRMKNISISRRICFLVLGVSALLAGCMRQEGVQQAAGPIVFRASVGSHQSKATDTAFEPGDAVGLLAGAPLSLSNVKLAWDGSVLVPETPISWEGVPRETKVAFSAYYPYQTAINPDGASLDFTIRADQSTHALYTASDLMGASTEASPADGAVNLRFNHLLSKMVIRIDNRLGEEIQAVYLGGVYGKVLLADGQAPQTQGYAGTVRAGKVTLDGTSAWVLIVAPGPMEPVLMVTTASQKQCTYTLPSAVTLQSGRCYNVHVALTQQSTLTDFSWEVADWTDDAQWQFGQEHIPPEPEPEPQTVLLYYESFDGDATFSGSKFLTDVQWQAAVGEGAANVTSTSWYGYLRKDNYGSAGNIGTYEGASGNAYARLIQSTKGVYGYLVISGIATLGCRDFTLSFGAAQGPSVMSVETSTDGGSTWTPVSYTFGDNYNHWSLVETTFSLAEEAETLQLRFYLIGDSSTYKYGANLDDIRLVGGGASAGPEPEPQPQGMNRYAELPVFDTTNPDYYYNTLYTHTVRTHKAVRNFSFCYDTRRHNPIWVAFPMHSIYAEGSGRSTDDNGNDPWMEYPDLPLSSQSIIWDITGDGKHMYWSASSAMIDGGSWTKGHLCMSSSRAGAGEEINLQTFYPVNIAPQSNAYAGIFADLWGDTEDFHWQRGSQICSDTLYVVAGCHYANDNTKEYDASNWGNRSSYSKVCVMPTHQFKVFLRTRNGNTGKAVQNCQASELKAIGFWLDSIIPDSASENIADYAVSVEEIEKKTGYTLFPGIPAEVKKQCNASDWGL